MDTPAQETPNQPAPPVYHCPKHGDTPFTIENSINGKLLGRYCFHCYDEMIAAHCTRFITADELAPGGGEATPETQ